MHETSNMLSRTLRSISNPHFWLVVVMFAVGAIFHYPQHTLGVALPSILTPLGVTRHAMERILFLLPSTYTGFMFGIRAGLVGVGVALVIMLPRVFWISPYSADALFETGGIAVVGTLVNLWFEGYRRERERGQQLLLGLEAAQEELQGHVEVIRANEKRLAALNEVSAIVSQSLELQDVLNAAIDKVREIMDSEVALVFLLDEEDKDLMLEVYRGVSEESAVRLDALGKGEGFSGLVAQTGEPLLMEDASLDPRRSQEVMKQEGIQAELCVPMKAKGKVLGTFCVATRGPRHFLPEEIELLANIANHVAVAVENARLYQKERIMAEQIAKDALVEKKMREDLRFYLQQVTMAQEEERRRIARELHDDTIQDLVVLSRRLDSLTRGADDADHLSAQDAAVIEELRRQTDNILGEIRRFSQDLRPSILDDLGLVPALEWLTFDLSQDFGIDIDIDVIGPLRRFPPEVELVVFRIAQEALRNVWKHAEASKAWVSLEFAADETILTVKDNGKGFELPERAQSLAAIGKLGLAGMQERAQLIGGRLTLHSEPGKGTTVTLMFPYESHLQTLG